MPPADDRPPSTTATPTSGRRLISRIASPFTAKSRSFGDNSIHLDDPHKQYSPGDVVSGYVEVRALKPTRITHVLVSLHGYVQVYKNPGSPPTDGHRANNALVGTGRGNRDGHYHGNGFATLFEDEIILCGDGRLSDGVYQFRFELEFPDRDLPSSISFERGNITYMVTATITRPVTISPIIQFDHKVFLVERIDIASIYPPKPRTITLEPISRKSRTRTQPRRLGDGSEIRGRGSDSQDLSHPRRESEASSSPSVRIDIDTPVSPAPSEGSLESGSLAPTSYDSNAGRQSDRTAGSRLSTYKSITTTVESLWGGCLRGDSVPVRVIVNHTKFVKSLYGVIITLYRQARVDMHPAIPLGPLTQDAGEGKYEDAFPKSITGLGGLSLSGGGSSHVFRKDLSQTMLPLVVDPTALTAEVNGKVHVPDEAFPTISSAPGGMISFRYYIEVVVDIQGKLSPQDRSMANRAGFGSSINPGVSAPQNGERMVFNQPGNNLIDTAALRRDKGVVSSTFEIVVGTRDSERRKGKRKVNPDAAAGGNAGAVADSAAQQPQQQQQQYAPDQHHPEQYDYPPDHQFPDGGYHYDHYGGYDPHYYGYSSHGSWHDHHHPYDGAASSPSSSAAAAAAAAAGDMGFVYNVPAYAHQPPVPMPRMEDETQLSEKERMRRAEARLLPSQPPAATSATGAAPAVNASEAEVGESAAQGGAGQEVEVGATAPYLPDEFDEPLPPRVDGPGIVVPYGEGSGSARHYQHPRPQQYQYQYQYPPQSQESARGEDEAAMAFDPETPRPRAVHPVGPASSSSAAAPVYFPATSTQPGQQAYLPPTDDKNELRRRELEMAASAPPPVLVPSAVASASAPLAEAAGEANLVAISNGTHASAPGFEDTNNAPSAPPAEIVFDGSHEDENYQSRKIGESVSGASGLDNGNGANGDHAYTQTQIQNHALDPVRQGNGSGYDYDDDNGHDHDGEQEAARDRNNDAHADAHEDKGLPRYER